MKQIKWWLMACLSLVLLTGCWDNQPVENRDLVMVIGIQPAPGGNLEVDLQIPTKAGMVQIPGAAGAAGSTPNSFYVLKGVGATFNSAFINAEAKTDRAIYLTQAQLLLFSTKLSADQFNNIMDATLRLGAIDKDVWVAATPDVTKVEEFKPLEAPNVPGLYFTDVFNCSTCQTVRTATRLWDIYQDQFSRGRNLNMPYLTLDSENYRLSEVTIYDHGRLADVLNPEQTIVLGWVKGIADRGVINMHTPYGKLSVRAIGGEFPKLHLRMTNGAPHELITLAMHGQLSQLTGHGSVLLRHYPQIQQLVNQQLAKLVLQLLVSLQQKGVDPMGFLLPYVWQHPEQFTQANSVHALLKKMRFTVVANIKLSNLGGKT